MQGSVAPRPSIGSLPNERELKTTYFSFQCYRHYFFIIIIIIIIIIIVTTVTIIIIIIVIIVVIIAITSTIIIITIVIILSSSSLLLSLLSSSSSLLLKYCLHRLHLKTVTNFRSFGNYSSLGCYAPGLRSATC